MTRLDGWDGPVPLNEGVYRYSKTVSWMRLYIEIYGSDFMGGITGCSESFEVAREDGIWKRFPTDLAYTPNGDLCMLLRDFSVLEVVMERVGSGVSLEEEISCVEDLAAYLERCIEP